MQSRVHALALVAAGVAPVVGLVERLVGDRTVIRPERALLALGGGLWRAQGYVGMLVAGLKERGLVFAEVGVVGDAPEEGAKALAAQARLAEEGVASSQQFMS